MGIGKEVTAHDMRSDTLL